MSQQDSAVMRNLTIMISSLVGLFVVMIVVARSIAY